MAEVAVETKFLEAVQKGAEYFVKQMKIELQQQGHSLTGDLENSMQVQAYEIAGGAVAEVYMNSYGIPLDTGVKASNIPYSRGSGAGTSEYIKGLTRFALLRRLAATEKEAKNVAFAIANKHKKEGMPTSGSYAFSKNGRRTSWIRETINRVSLDVEIIMLKEIGNIIESEIELAFKVE